MGDLDGDGYEEFIAGGGDNWAYLFTAGPEDADEDGHTEVDDCDETDPSIPPGAEDICGDGIDSDCDGVGAQGSDDEDEDGLSEEEEDTTSAQAHATRTLTEMVSLMEKRSGKAPPPLCLMSSTLGSLKTQDKKRTWDRRKPAHQRIPLRAAGAPHRKGLTRCSGSSLWG